MDVATASAAHLLVPGAERLHREVQRGQVVTVHLDGLTKRFAPRTSLRDIARFARRAPPVTVVDGVTLDVFRGEVFGLLGPNGAGKTTIFKMLSTMIAPDAGSASVAGFDVATQPRAVLGALASVPADERSLNWRLTARQNLLLFAALQRVPREATADRVTWALRTVALSDTGGKRVGEFSSGMRQRLLIARALLTRPQILLLDEPTRTLDPLSAREFRRFLLEELVGRYGCTILLATHNTDEAIGFCDRVAVLHHGRVLATGATQVLAARYGEARFRVVVRDATHPAFALLEGRGLLQRVVVAERSADGWTKLECTIAGGASRSAEALRLLIESGADVACLERVELSLADLIAQIITADPTVVRHA
jgi:ABC-2 type transport system ATP-binding protein